MDQFASHLRDLTERFTGQKVQAIVDHIGNEYATADETRRLCMRSIRYFVRHGVVPLHLTYGDAQVLRALAVDLVKKGVENGGLPPEAMACFL